MQRVRRERPPTMVAKNCKFEQVFAGHEIKDERFITVDGGEQHDYEIPKFSFPKRVKKIDIYNVGSTSG